MNDKNRKSWDNITNQLRDLNARADRLRARQRKIISLLPVSKKRS